MGGVEVETERDRHRGHTGSLLHSLIRPRIYGDLAFPLDLRIEREETVVHIDGEPRSVEAYILDDDVVAHASVGEVHVAVRCWRDDLEWLRLERLGRDALDEVCQE